MLMTLSHPLAAAGGSRRVNTLLALGFRTAAACLLIALLAATLPAFIGWHAITVTGGSMGSALPAGSIAVTRPIAGSAVNEGDVVVFARRGSTPVLHRIVELGTAEGGGRIAYTRGDANETRDPQPIALGGNGEVVVYHIPWLGYVIALVQLQAARAFVAFAAVAWCARGAVRHIRTRHHEPAHSQ